MEEIPLPSSGATSPAIPRTNMMLNRFDPTTFPMARSGLFRNAAIRAVANSGVPVPMETMVSPIRASLSPKILARSTAPVTRKLAPKPNVTIPNIKKPTSRHKVLPESSGISIPSILSSSGEVLLTVMMFPVT